MQPDEAPYIDRDLGFSLVPFTSEMERRYPGEFGAFSYRWPNANGPWFVDGYLAVQDGQVVIEQIRISPAVVRIRGEEDPRSADDIPRKGITTDVLRLPLRTILGKALEKVLEAPGLYPSEDPRQAEAVRIAEEVKDLANEGRRRGNRELGDESYAQTALAYMRAVQAGTRDVTGAVAEHLGVRRSVASTRIRESRARRFLPPGTPGRSSASPGPRLVEWLSRQPNSPARSGTDDPGSTSRRSPR